MKIKLLLLALSFLLSLFANQAVFAKGPSDGVTMMAKILVHLNHYPSGGEKKSLAKLVSGDSATENERIIATAMMNLQHKVSSADRKKLSEVIDGSNSTSDEVALAKILRSLSHQPSSSDRKRLKSMIP